MTLMQASPLRRWAPLAAALALLVVMVALSRDYGFTWDERFQQKYGEEIWDYYHGRLPRAAFDNDIGQQYLYSGLVEVLCVAAQHVVPGDTYVVRHALVASFGWLAVVMIGLIGARLGGGGAGWLAAVLLAVSPRFLGDAMNNSKDIPFAALSLVVIYLLLRASRSSPYLSWRLAAALTLAIGASISIRPVGVVLLAMSAATVGGVAALDQLRRRRLDPGAIAALAPRLAVMVLALPLGTIAWPWAQASPFVRPVRGFLLASRLDWTAFYGVLYRGSDLDASHLPWHYVPTWIAISTPPVILAGLLLAPLAWRTLPRARMGLAVVGFFVGTLLLGVITRHSTLYDGIRHLTFLLLPLTAIAATGWMALLHRAGAIRAAALAALLVGLAEPVLFAARNHPNEIVYFNPLAGGPRDAFLRYDMDYWANSMLQAVSWSAELARESGMAIGVSGNPAQAVEADAARYRSLWFAPRDAKTFHLDIRLLHGPRDAIREFTERPDVLYRVTTADGTPLCIVLPGPAYSELVAARDKRVTRR